MFAPDPKLLAAQFDRLSPVHHVGRVTAVQGGVISVSGLAARARIGDRLILQRGCGPDLDGEVLQVAGDTLRMLPDRAPEGVALGNRVSLERMPDFSPGLHWLGRVVDPFGRPLDGRPLLGDRRARDLMQAPPPAVSRKPLGARLPTGMAVLNTVLPVVQGQRIGLFAGSGVGKSTLLATLARQMQADAVVVALIGERGREVNEFVDRALGRDGMSRALVVAATSDQSALVRRRCAWAAISAAEMLREQGLNVLFLADSVTRFAEAHREVSAAMGEAPALRGYPPSVTPLITGLCERAGPGPEGQGDITAVFSVLVAGSDMDEPVADILRGVLDGHVVLDREIAERGRFPAIDVSRSISRSLPDAASDAENEMIAEARRLLGSYERSEVMIKAGLYSEGSDPTLDKAVRVWPELDAFFARPETGGIADSFDKLSLILRRAAGPALRG
ncbi:flagellum-specific ATP synthase [Cribrihabitans marinus]|uniref:Flagellum-specific ATP synthase n=1 Tax=Cribrihabitans marinus TaxID=1227549 RepID=A0A1H7DIR0_9RHOB|nr:FliI/YscN family ATPase [Cribrihabitans marinus]GGH39538.1 ATP synthase [Cribrihabitans marinus]SEK01498.1 flagellum-specific ATP synthase [Cribrihabitans marinus]